VSSSKISEENQGALEMGAMGRIGCLCNYLLLY